MNAPTPTGLTWLRRFTWWTLIACLALSAGLVTAEPGVSKLVTVPAVLLVCGVAAWLFAVAVLGSRPPRTPILVLLLALAAPAAGGILGSSPEGGFPWALPLAALAAAVQAGAGMTDGAARWWAGLGFAVLAFVSALSGGRSLGSAAADTAIAALCAAGLYAQIWILAVAERLDHARTLERTAAVADERLRFAAELHDIQGHNLQVIALKSELAERLAGIDPGRAAAEMREVQALARQALGDTREVVHGYRQVTLDVELANAVRVLEAAGIEASLTQSGSSEGLPPLLGLVARECTTNVLKHSDARSCTIDLTAGDGSVRLRFTNDAPRGERSGPAGGLAALGDRLTAAGGELTFDGTAEAFTVSARLPWP